MWQMCQKEKVIILTIINSENDFSIIGLYHYQQNCTIYGDRQVGKLRIDTLIASSLVYLDLRFNSDVVDVDAMTVFWSV